MNYGRYQIINEVGRGSMGVVYQCRDPHIERLVAVKVLRSDRVESENFVRRFLKEARVIGRLAHPNIVTIYDVGEEQGTVFIAMEFLEGKALSELMRVNPPPLHEVVGLGVQLAETLDYAHGKGVVHRDVKPSNIIVQPDGQIRITDFGIAHVDDATATLQTQAGEIMGTPAYMSPEQVLSQPVDARSDIFSMGIIMYELTTGRRPFGGDSKSLVTVFNDIVELTPPEPASLAAAIPAELSLVIMKALNKDPLQRFQSGKEMAEALKGALAPPASAREATLGAQQRTLTKGQTKLTGSEGKAARKFAIAAGGMVLALVILGGGAIFFTSNKQGHKEVAATLAKPDTGAPVAAAPRIPDAAVIPPVAPADAAPGLADVAKPAAAPSAAGKKSAKPTKVQGKTPAPRLPLNKSKPEQRVQEAQGVPSPITAGRAEPAAAAASASGIAFLNLETTPPGARIYINGEAKGTTPKIVKLKLGEYRVRLARPGYQEIERKVSLDEVKEYPVLELMRRTE